MVRHREDSTREDRHPFKGQPLPEAPPRITGYTGHRPKAYEPIGMGFNRIEYVHGQRGYGQGAPPRSSTCTPRMPTHADACQRTPLCHLQVWVFPHADECRRTGF